MRKDAQPILLHPETATYDVISKSDGHEILDRLQQRFSASREERPIRNATFYDTFDWRLYKDDSVLCAYPDDGCQLLIWHSANEGPVRNRLRVDAPPGFAWDLPAGSFRAGLSKIIAMRRLLPLVEAEFHGCSIRIFDADGRKALRVDLEYGSATKPDASGFRAALPTRLRLVPSKGFSEIFWEILRFIEAELGLRRAESNELTLALEAIGAVPGNYSSKIRVNLEPEMRTDDALRSVYRSLLDSMLANEEGARLGIDTEFLHDFRVAVRRTRAYLAHFKGVFSDEKIQHFRSEFAWLGSITGPTRDLDVYLLKFDSYREILPAAIRDDLDPLLEFLKKQQQLEQGRLASTLLSLRYRALVLNWKEFLDEEEMPPDPSLPNAARPIIAVASEQLARRFVRVLKKGTSISKGTQAEALHRLRINCKKLRYLLEFLRSLYDPTHLRKLVSELKKLQDNLGDFNDLHVQQEAISRFAREMAEENMAGPDTLLAMGRLLSGLTKRQAVERKSFHRRFARFSRRANRERFRLMVEPTQD